MTIKPKTRQVCIGFSRSRRKFPLFSWLIRLVQGTEYSHVYVRWESQTAGQSMVYHASGSNLHFITQDRFSKWNKNISMFPLTLTQRQYQKLLQICMQSAGIRYGIRQLIGIGIANMFGWRKNPLADGTRTMICSELVGRILNEVFDQNISDRDLEMAGPKQLHEMLNKMIATRDKRK